MARPITNCEHLDRKHHAKGLCRSCYEKIQTKNLSKRAEACRTWRKRHPEKVRDGYRRDRLKRDPRNHANAAMKYRLARMGLDSGKLQAMIQLQNNKCAICGVSLAEIETKNVHVDHDHLTGKARGVLCHYCNAVLGFAKDSKDVLSKAITYLQSPPFNLLEETQDVGEAQTL